MMLALKSGPQIAAKVGNPAGLLCRRIWYSVVKSGVLGITEYRQGRPLLKFQDRIFPSQCVVRRAVGLLEYLQQPSDRGVGLEPLGRGLDTHRAWFDFYA